MNLITLSHSPLGRLTSIFGLMLRRPPRRQVAALCYRRRGSELEVLLITSRDTRRWIIPKGWPGARRSARKQAAREAFEEAGIRGAVARHPLGEYRSHKGLGRGFKVRTSVTVFPLRAEDQARDFPERGERDLAWMPLREAASRCGEPGLAAILGSREIESLLMAG
ncbi:MAG: NUDIX hydrolase [Nitratireductor sp.]|nr:NUDIX hydrolase [Nitratireductor sp.]